MKKIIIGFIVGALIFSIIPVSAAVQEYILHKAEYDIMIGGKLYDSQDLPILNYEGNTYVPLTKVGEMLGGNVKWNEELEQVEIIKETILPEPIPDKGDDVVSDKQVYEENDYKVIMDNEVEYYSWKSICDNIEPKGYNIGYDKTKDSMFLIKYNAIKKSTADSTKILESIPYKIFNDATHIPKDYYLNKILPLIK